MILAGYMGKLSVLGLESWQRRFCLKSSGREVKRMGIKIEDLTVTFRNKVTAVHHADLEIPKGIFIELDAAADLAALPLGERNHAHAGAHDCVDANQRYRDLGRNVLQ